MNTAKKTRTPRPKLVKPAPTGPKDSDQFLTPPHLVDALMMFFQHQIDFDPFAHPKQLLPAQRCRTWYEREAKIPPDALRVATNIPFSDSHNAISELNEHTIRAGATVVFLTACWVGTKYWERFIWKNPLCFGIAFLPRTKFYQENQSGDVEECKSSILRTDTAFVGLSSQPKHVLHRPFEETFTPVSRYVLLR